MISAKRWAALSAVALVLTGGWPATADAGPIAQKMAQQHHDRQRIEREAAIAELKLKAEPGDPTAQFQLGKLYLEPGYLEGGGYGTDISEAEKWLVMAAEQGDVGMQKELAGFYYRGTLGTSFVEARKWFRRAALQGDREAQQRLGGLYLNGYGTPQDYSEAMKWLLLSANQGWAQAQHQLGGMYETGKGAPPSDIIAHMWFNLAAALKPRVRFFSSEEAPTARRAVLEKRMTRSDVAEAQKLAREWMLAHPPVSVVRVFRTEGRLR